MITKETFCSLLSCCRNMQEYNQKLESVNLILDDKHPFFTTIDTIIFSLDDELDTDNVSYYFFERDCDGMTLHGKPVPFLWEKDGTEVWIHSDEELYEYLTKGTEGTRYRCQ